MPTEVGGSKATYTMAEKALQIYAEVQAHLKAANAKYMVEADKHQHKKVFQESELLMVHLWCSQFPSIRAKLEKRKYGPF